MCVADAGLTPPKDWYRATAWLTLPVSLSRPAYGCIVVDTRQAAAMSSLWSESEQSGNLMVLGGNQGDAVSIRPFALSRGIAGRPPTRRRPASSFHCWIPTAVSEDEA